MVEPACQCFATSEEAKSSLEQDLRKLLKEGSLFFLDQLTLQTDPEV